MEKTKLIPAIRFNSFTDDWGRRKLGSMGTTYTGLSGKTKEDFGHGDARFITYMNVFSNPIIDPDMVEPIEIDNKQKETEIGDVFFTTSSETPEEVGMSSVLLEKKGYTYLNSFCFGYRPTEKLNPNYLAFMLRSKGVRKDIVLLAQGISRYNISKNKMMEIEVPVPSIAEQEKIGGNFRNIDSLIAFYRCKLEKMQTVKQSLLEKMFPQNGSNVPEIRFNGFTSSWDQHRLDELIVQGGSGGTPKTSNPDYYTGTIPFLSITDVTNSNGLIYETEKHISEDGLNNSAAWIVPAESVSLAMYASVGKVAVLKNDIATSQAFYSMVFSDIPKRDFIYQYLKKMEEFGEWEPVISTGTQRNLNAEKVKSLIISIPKEIEEQKKIGSFLNSVDNLISIYQDKLNSLDIIKKAFLDKMFVKVEV